jgi:predicted CoA-binding protein
MNIYDFLNKKNVFAVVGASRDKNKYGNKVFHELKDNGYKVYPVNPNARDIDGFKCYPNLKSLPEKPDVISLVVPPEITESIVKEAHKLKINKIWMQPGSESEKALDFCKKNNVKVLHGVCVIVSLANQLR